MPHYAILIYANDAPPTPFKVAAERSSHDAPAAALTATGTLQVAYALTPRADAVAIHDGTEHDGPLGDAPQILVGFHIIDAPDFATAIAIAHHNPAANTADAGIEVRPISNGRALDRNSAGR